MCLYSGLEGQYILMSQVRSELVSTSYKIWRISYALRRSVSVNVLKSIKISFIHQDWKYSVLYFNSRIVSNCFVASLNEEWAVDRGILNSRPISVMYSTAQGSKIQNYNLGFTRRSSHVTRPPQYSCDRSGSDTSQADKLQTDWRCCEKYLGQDSPYPCKHFYLKYFIRIPLRVAGILCSSSLTIFKSCNNERVKV